MDTKYLYCPFCKLTKRGRAKSFSYYELLDHLREHGSDYVKISGKVIFVKDVEPLVRTLEDLGVIKK